MLLRSGLLFLAATQIVLAIWQVADPSSFHDRLADFGPQNDHYLHDVAAWEASLAIVAIAAAWRPSWAAPVLVFATVQFVLHTISHIVDASDARGDTSGAFDAISLGIGAFLLAGLARMALSESCARVT